MKSKFLSFIKPRGWTVLLTIFFVVWQYFYAFRGIDFDVLAQLRSYFGFGLTAINWNDFLIRTLSLALIWLFVALIIFGLLWLAEYFIVTSHNRKITKQYLNQPKEDYLHLLKTHDLSFKKRFGANLWLSAFIILILVGAFLLSGLLETLRSNLVISYITAAQDSGSNIDYYDTTVTIISFLITLPLWYLFSCFDTWCFLASREDKAEAKIESEHYAVPVVTPDISSDDSEFDTNDQAENDSNLPPSPVI